MGAHATKQCRKLASVCPIQDDQPPNNGQALRLINKGRHPSIKTALLTATFALTQLAGANGQDIRSTHHTEQTRPMAHHHLCITAPTRGRPYTAAPFNNEGQDNFLKWLKAPALPTQRLAPNAPERGRPSHRQAEPLGGQTNAAACNHSKRQGKNQTWLKLMDKIVSAMSSDDSTAQPPGRQSHLTRGTSLATATAPPTGPRPRPTGVPATRGEGRSRPFALSGGRAKTSQCVS